MDSQLHEGVEPMARRLHRHDLVTRKEIESFFEESRRSRKDMLETVHALTLSVKEVREEMKEFKGATKDMVEAFRNLQGLSSILVWIGKIMKPLVWIAAVAAATTAYLQGIKIPKLIG